MDATGLVVVVVLASLLLGVIPAAMAERKGRNTKCPHCGTTLEGIVSMTL